jgi:hypothetical protein
VAGESSVCRQCGEPPGKIRPSGNLAPKCGSTSRKFAVSQLLTASTSVTVQTEVITYPQRLMTMARRLIDEGQFSFAVVVAHTACEIAIERRLSELFAAKGIQYLEDWAGGVLNSYNLGNERVRGLYTALTGDEVQKQESLWSTFRASVRRRNKIVHKGVMVEKADAEESYKAASDLLAHLNK